MRQKKKSKSSYTGACIVPILMTTCYVVLEVVSRAVTKTANVHKGILLLGLV